VNRWSFKRRSSWALVTAPALAVAGLSVAASPAVAHTHTAAQTTATEHFTVRPNPVNMLDCNGWSKKYRSVNPGFRGLCTDPHGKLRTKPYASPATGSKNYWGRLVDNGHYVGHDEPSVKFISSAAGSGNTMTYFMRLPTDPRKAPTNTGSVTKYAELSPAPWFGLPLCDPGSYPQNACTPKSDKNSGLISDANAAGSAFMELQFYAPGIQPFQDAPSCTRTKWCIAITIDSLEAQFNFANFNLNCPEPVNFAYLQDNGVPAGPPSPQLINGHSFTPNSHTLELNPGDVLRVHISDPLTGPHAGFTATVADLTTGKTGFMTASAANGFMNTDFKTCAGSPFTFHAEYKTASQQNQVPWAALEGGVLMQQEIGHNEVCASLTHHNPTTAAGLVDKQTFDTCVGANEGKHAGEGSCNGKTGVCQNPQTEGTTGPIACPSNNFASGQLCEYADGTCLPQGTRTIRLNGVLTKVKSPVNLCQANRFQNGDLDFDGLSYHGTSWPNGTSSTPTSFRYVGPFDPNGNPYPNIQFETDAAGSEFLCNLFNGNLCQVPPLAAKFYPFFTTTNKAGQGVGHGMFPTGTCTWNFGNTIKGVTTRNFGKDAQYGAPDVARFAGTVISAVIHNPQIGSGCPALTQP
jgi:hypothetical protein